VVKPIENRSRDDGTKALDRSMNGSVLVQGAMRPREFRWLRLCGVWLLNKSGHQDDEVRAGMIEIERRGLDR